MAIYRNIQMTFWTDTKIIDDFTPEDKYFYLYLFTNPHTNLAGCYEISIKLVAYETGYSTETIERLLLRFSEIHKVCEYSLETKEVLLLNWYKYNWTASEKFRKPLLSQIESIKCDTFRNYLMEIFNGKNTVSIPYQYGMDTTVTVTDTVTDTDTITDKSIPTIDEVYAYCKERKNGINPEAFYDFYESKGWMVGKNKMQDWKACVRTWEKRERQDKQKDTSKLDELERRYLEE